MQGGQVIEKENKDVFTVEQMLEESTVAEPCYQMVPTW